MKRKIALLICATMAFSGVTGCNKTTTVSNTGETTSTVEESSSAEETTKVDEFANVDKALLAKLMLANERLCLDSEEIDDMAFDVLEDSELSISSENASFLKKPQNYDMGTCNKNGDTYEWSNFPDFSILQDAVEATYVGVLNDIDYYSEQIDIIKEGACSLDTWVIIDGLNRPSLLSVTEDTEVLYTTGNLNGGYNVCKRYTDEYARSVYEMYSVHSLQNESNLSRNLTIYVEDTLIDSCTWANFGDLVEYRRIENEGDYWTSFMISKIHDALYTGYYFIDSKDSNISYCYEFDYVEDVPVNVSLHLIDNVNKSALPAYSGQTLIVPLNSLKGYTCVRETDTDGTSVRPHPNGGYATSGINSKLILANGEELLAESSLMDNQIVMSYISVDRLVAPSRYYGEVRFHINECQDYMANINTFKEFLTQYGLSFNLDTDEIFDEYIKHQNSGEEILSSHTINNMPIASYADIENILNAMETKSKESVQLYETVKYNPSEIPVEFDITKIDFPSISVSADNATLSSSWIIIDSMSVVMADTFLLEQGEEYKVRLACVKQGEDGLEPWGFLWIPIENETTKTYEGGDTFEITTAFGMISSELVVALGTYTVAAYICDKDGIRVSEFEPVVFESGTKSQYGFQFENGEEYNYLMDLDENNYITIKCRSIENWH